MAGSWLLHRLSGPSMSRTEHTGVSGPEMTAVVIVECVYLQFWGHNHDCLYMFLEPEGTKGRVGI